MKREIICTVCPLGCSINVEGSKETILNIEGNQCKRGEGFAKAEFLHPERILTSTIKTNDKNKQLVSVRSEKPVPKDSLFKCMEEIKKAEVELPISIYDVLIENIAETGINIVATETVPPKI